MSYISMDLFRQALQTDRKLFFKFRIRFRIIGRKQKNIQTNIEVWILINVQYIVYQKICLDMLYELMETFFQISESFFEWATLF